MRTFFALFCCAALFTVLLTPLVRRLALRLGAFGVADAGRTPGSVPRLGGLAVFAASICTWLLLLAFPTDVRTRFIDEWHTLALMLAPSLVMLAVGVIDDLKGSRALEKFAVQFLAGALAWSAGFRITQVPVIGSSIFSPWLSFLFTVAWIVAVTNAFNLVDGLDGLAAGIGFFVSITIFIVDLLQHSFSQATFAIVIAGALVGFLKFNFAPAQIYLGDSGSLVVGFLLSLMAVATSQKSPTLLAIAVPYLALGLPLLDTTMAVIRRFLRGQRVFSADTDHIHHRVLRRLKNPQLAALVLYGVAAFFSLGSLLILHWSGSVPALIALLCGCSAWMLTRILKYNEFAELNAYVTQSVRQHRRLVAKRLEMRRIGRRIEESASVTEAWSLFQAGVQTLGFDAVYCTLSDDLSADFVCEPNGSNGATEESVCLVIPLSYGERSIGRLSLEARAAAASEVLEMSALLFELARPLGQRIISNNAAQAASA